MSSLIFAVALSTAGYARASVLWTGDFETGNLSQWSYKFLEKQLRVVPMPTRDGKFALEVTAINSGDRVEVQNGRASTVVGSDRYYAWSVMTPKPLGPNDHQTGYFESKNTYNQIMAFVIRGSDVALDTRLPTSQRRWTGRGKFTAGVWHDFVIHVKWSRDAATGLVELWFDGQKVLEPVRLPTLWDANDAFFQIGFLSGQAGEILYIDEAREATSLEDVLRVATPPADAGVPVGGTGGGVAATGGQSGAGGMVGNSGGSGGSSSSSAGGAGGRGEGSGGKQGGAGGEKQTANGAGSDEEPNPSSGQAEGRVGCVWASRGVDGPAAAWSLLVLFGLSVALRKRHQP